MLLLSSKSLSILTNKLFKNTFWHFPHLADATRVTNPSPGASGGGHLTGSHLGGADTDLEEYGKILWKKMKFP